MIDKDTSDEIRRIEEHIAQLEEEIELDGRSLAWARARLHEANEEKERLKRRRRV